MVKKKILSIIKTDVLKVIVNFEEKLRFFSQETNIQKYQKFDTNELEVLLIPLLEYLNIQLGTLNENLDQNIATFVRKQYPWFVDFSLNLDGKEKNLQDYEKSNLVLLMIWREIVLFFRLHFNTYKNNEGYEENKTNLKYNQVLALFYTLEMIKSLFYCGPYVGFSFKELEHEVYNDLKEELKNVIKEFNNS